ncbi:MAG: amidohydrolase [Synergistaceae bacterium]|nr:amidohydrolase [Synergistaceae bacterium]
MTPDFIKLAQSEKEWLVGIRRDIHRHPETGFDLDRTAAIVEDTLEGLGIPTKRIARTGIIGRLRGGKPGPVSGFRADMDALELNDEKQVLYASEVPGKMHACGHDAHTAILLGAAKLLSPLRGELAGEVRFLFQPAEETDGGALPMIRDGAMEDPEVDAVFGLHVAPGYPTGSIGLSFGKLHASSDMFDLEIQGRGSHGAAPHLGVDALAAGCQVVSALQQITSREVDPLNPIVVTVGTFLSGTQRNIIAGKAEMKGIIRTLDPQTRLWARDRVRKIAEGVASALGTSAHLNFTEGYPCVINDSKLAGFVESIAHELLGPDSVNIMNQPTMGVDDFAYFIERRQGVLFMLGVGNAEKKTDYPLHSNLFDIDEDCLPLGSAILARIAYDFPKRPEARI